MTALVRRLGRLFERRADDAGPWAEERASARFPTRIRAAGSGCRFTQERSGNVGIGGFCFEAEAALPAGAALTLLVALDECPEGWIRVRGEVLGTAQLRRGKLGVRGRFVELHPEDERLLARWLDRLALQARAA